MKGERWCWMNMRETWEKWVKNPFRKERGSFIDHEAVIDVAEEMG